MVLLEEVIETEEESVLPGEVCSDTEVEEEILQKSASTTSGAGVEKVTPGIEKTAVESRKSVDDLREFFEDQIPGRDKSSETIKKGAKLSQSPRKEVESTVQKVKSIPTPVQKIPPVVEKEGLAVDEEVEKQPQTKPAEVESKPEAKEAKVEPKKVVESRPAAVPKPQPKAEESKKGPEPKTFAEKQKKKVAAPAPKSIPAQKKVTKPVKKFADSSSATATATAAPSGTPFVFEEKVGKLLSKGIYGAPVWAWLGALLSILFFRWLYPWPFIVRFVLACLFNGVYILGAVHKTNILTDFEEDSESDSEEEEEELTEEQIKQKTKQPATPLNSAATRSKTDKKPTMAKVDKPAAKSAAKSKTESSSTKASGPSNGSSSKKTEDCEPKIETVHEGASDAEERAAPGTSDARDKGRNNPFPEMKERTAMFDHPKYLSDTESSDDEGVVRRQRQREHEDDDGRPIPLHGKDDADEEEYDLEQEETAAVEYDADFAAECKQEGNQHYLKGSLNLALKCYSDAIEFCPPGNTEQLAVYYANRAAARMQQKQFDKVVEDCTHAIDANPNYLKALTRRSNAYEKQEKWHDALEDLKKVCELDPTQQMKEFKRIKELEVKAQKQFDADKDKMVGQLKELGDMFLGKFGMSTDNFAMQQDPSTGQYSFSMKS